MHLRRTLALIFALATPALFAQKTIRVPADQPTIQAGINATNDGDTVLVDAGIYHESIDFLGKAITLRAATSNPADTVIDASGANIGVRFHSAETRGSVLSGFTVRGAASGIVAENSAPTILNNTVLGNSCSGIVSSYGAADIEGNTVSGTTNANSSCEFKNNAPILLTGVTDSGLAGAGLQTMVVRNFVHDNSMRALATTSESYAAGIGDLGQAAVIRNNIIRDNVSVGTGGGLVVEPIYGSYDTTTPVTIVSGNLITGNSAACGAGGIYVGFFSPDFLDPIKLFIVNNTVVNNTVSNSSCLNVNSGTEVSLYWDSNQIYLLNNIFADTSGATVLHCVGSGIMLPLFGVSGLDVADHNVFYNGSQTSSSIEDACLNSQPFLAASSFAAPGFLSATDFHLLSSSPFVDQGNNTAALYTASTDLDGNPRIASSTSAAAVIDLGAYERPGAANTDSTQTTLSPDMWNYAGGASAKLTVQVSSAFGTPTGVAHITLDGQPLTDGTLDSSGKFVVSVPRLVPGKRVFIATFEGSAGFSPSVSAQVIVAVAKYIPSITLTATPNPSSVGQSVLFQAKITSPEGAILSPLRFHQANDNGGTNVPSDVTGSASFSTTFNTPGSVTYLVSFDGDDTHKSATASVVQQVVDGNATTTTLTSSLNPSVINQNVTFTATVSGSNGSPTGTVTFSDGSTALGTATLANGVATYSSSTLAAGTHSITATYNAISPYASSSASLNQVVQSGYATNATITSSANPSQLGQNVTFSIAVLAGSIAPTGTISLSDNSTPLGTLTLDVYGSAHYSTSTLTRGTHTITAIYNPTGSFAGSTTSIPQVVNGYASSVTAGPIQSGLLAGSSTTFTASVLPAATGAPSAPTGAVTFALDGVSLGSVNINTAGAAAIPSGILHGGSHTLTCSYAGDGLFNPSTCAPTSFAVAQATPTFTLTSSANPAYALAPITYAARLSLNGTLVPDVIVFALDGTPLTSGQVNATGQNQIQQSLSVGNHTLTARSSGDNDVTADTASVAQVVLPNNTSLVLSLASASISEGQDANATVILNDLTGPAAAYGSVTIYDGNTALLTLTAQPAGTSALSAVLMNLSVGTHSISAFYVPSDGNFLGSGSAPVTLVVNPSSIDLTTDPTSISIQTEHHKSLTVTAQSIGVFAGPVTFSCGPNLPRVLTCRFSSAGVTLTAGGKASSTLTLETDAVGNFYADARPAPLSPLRHPITALASLVGLGLLARRRRKLAVLATLLLALTASATLTGCTGKWPDHTPVGTYDIVLTATGTQPNGLQATKSAHLNLTVTP
ncbi:Ig-like domain repeat protein [Granulicella cerasi]|uniref:Ig-like domain repeat protein n=1 Tax=Granulicella cerasi TaxID=741063 RepID=A0ABW1ZCQ2_9BACT|nr:Ig-like domain-containing protein [Granulicella cerasi]